MKQKYYHAPNPLLWQGRKTKHLQEYWYQEIQCYSLFEDDLPSVDIAIIGYASDEGVRRNQGRVGAFAGPDAIRARLGKAAYHLKGKELIDVGNIVCLDAQLEESQNIFAAEICKLLDHHLFPIALGGGHDIAYAHLKGIEKALNKKERMKIGIINFDAHFDLRPINEQANSGTPFYQILQEHSERVNYMAIGIQKAANTAKLFEIADMHGVQYVFSEDCTLGQINNTLTKIETFLNTQDLIYLSIDLDGFSSAYAPGVSAPSPLGFSPHFVWKALEPILSSGKLLSCDIAEYNPKFDVDDHTANLAARLVEYIARLAQPINIAQIV